MSAVPTIFSLKMKLYFQIFSVIIVLVIIGLCLWYSIFKYKLRKKLLHNISNIKSQSKKLEKDILINKIKESDWEQMLIYWIEYLERFSMWRKYHSIDEIFSQNWFNSKEISKITKVLYSGASLDTNLRDKILESFN